MREVDDILYNTLVMMSPEIKIYMTLFTKKILEYWHKVRQKKLKTT